MRCGCSRSPPPCGLPALGGLWRTAMRRVAFFAERRRDRVDRAVYLQPLRVYWRAVRLADDQTVNAMLEAALPLAKELLHKGSARLSGDAAACHAFRVCSGLESMVLGEAEILGQVRCAIEQSPGAGPFLRGVFTAAIRTGRGARASTGIGTGALSVASAAIEQLELCVPLGDKRVLLIGAGETAAKVARQLRAFNVGTLVIANRTLDRAQALAAGTGAIAVGLEAIADEIAAAHVVICATHSTSWMVTHAHVASRTPASPLVLVDLSMPPAIEPFVREWRGPHRPARSGVGRRRLPPASRERDPEGRSIHYP